MSCMHTRSIILPEKDPELCARVLLEAEFLGVEWLLQEVKARAARKPSASCMGSSTVNKTRESHAPRTPRCSTFRQICGRVFVPVSGV